MLANRFKDAEFLLKQISLPKFTKKRSYLYLFYYSNFASLYIENRNFEKAKQYIDEIRALNSSGLDLALAHSVNESATIRQYILNLAKGETEGAEEYFHAMLDLSTNLLEELTSKFHLARVLILKGRAEEARPLLQYVSDKGRDIGIAKKARKILEGIQ